MRNSLLIMMSVAALFAVSCGSPANENRGNRGSNDRSGPASPSGTMPVSPTPPTDEADVRKIVVDLAAALTKNDADALEALYSDGCTLINANGEVTTKPEWLTIIRSGEMKFEQAAFQDINVRAYDRAAVAVALATGRSMVNGKPDTSERRVTMIFVKENDKWRIVNSQSTTVRPGPISGDGSGGSQPTNNGSSANANGSNRRASANK